MKKIAIKVSNNLESLQIDFMPKKNLFSCFLFAICTFPMNSFQLTEVGSDFEILTPPCPLKGAGFGFGCVIARIITANERSECSRNGFVAIP